VWNGRVQPFFKTQNGVRASLTQEGKKRSPTDRPKRIISSAERTFTSSLDRLKTILEGFFAISFVQKSLERPGGGSFGKKRSGYQRTMHFAATGFLRKIILLPKRLSENEQKGSALTEESYSCSAHEGGGVLMEIPSLTPQSLLHIPQKFPVIKPLPTEV
jgi:hypothetical protein